MPTYTYRCLNCKKRFEIFLTYAEYGVKPVACKHCGSEDVQRRIGRIRIAKSIESRLDSMDSLEDADSLEGLEDDPRALGRMMRKMGHEMGEELPPEFDEVVDRLEAGQSPEEIEEALPDLDLPGGESSAGLDDDL